LKLGTFISKFLQIFVFFFQFFFSNPSIALRRKIRGSINSLGECGLDDVLYHKYMPDWSENMDMQYIYMRVACRCDDMGGLRNPHRQRLEGASAYQLARLEGA
jgi:hypothetical protein